MELRFFHVFQTRPVGNEVREREAPTKGVRAPPLHENGQVRVGDGGSPGLPVRIRGGWGEGPLSRGGLGGRGQLAVVRFWGAGQTDLAGSV